VSFENNRGFTPRFFLGLLLAIQTSQAAGAWPETVLKRRLPLLSPAPVLKAPSEDETDLQAA